MLLVKLINFTGLLRNTYGVCCSSFEVRPRWAGKLRYSAHANLRMKERNIIKPEIEHVLTRGIHNKAKDKFEDKFQTWDYCVEGTTIDGRLLRIIVTFVEPNLLVVTTINLNSRK